MHKRHRTIIGVAVIIVFGGLGILSFVGTANPYVGFEKARTMQSKVQVLGIVDHNNTYYDENTGIFSFYLIDETGDRMKAAYSGIKPGNFEQAKSVVCKGIFKDSVFSVDELLVKCPSKYQGNE